VLVCSSCRTANEEDAAVCASCGSELKPSFASLRSRREGPVQIDIVPPPLAKRWPRLTALAVVAAGLIAWGVWSVARHHPCDGKYASAQFAYCVAVPEGWNPSGARLGSVDVDQFTRTPASAFVLSVEFRAEVSLREYAKAARRQDRRQGLSYGDLRETRLGGLRAFEWDLTSEDLPRFQGLEVVTVSGKTGWTVQLNDAADSFPQNIGSFRSMLASWSFR
jgi:hypothetical protein